MQKFACTVRVVNAAAGRNEEAIKQLEEALQLDPGLEAREEVKRLRIKPGE